MPMCCSKLRLLQSIDCTGTSNWDLFCTASDKQICVTQCLNVVLHRLYTMLSYFMKIKFKHFYGQHSLIFGSFSFYFLCIQHNYKTNYCSIIILSFKGITILPELLHLLFPFQNGERQNSVTHFTMGWYGIAHTVLFLYCGVTSI